jgi:hypothetical protein
VTLIRVEILSSNGRSDAAMRDLARVRPMAEQHGSSDFFVAHLDHGAWLYYSAGDVGATLDP